MGVQEKKPELMGSVAVLEPNPSASRAIEAWLHAWGSRAIILPDGDSLECLLMEPQSRDGVRAVVVNEAAVSTGGHAILQTLAESPDGLRPLVVLLSGWNSTFDRSESGLESGIVVLKQPLSESDLLRALERSGKPSMRDSLHSLAKLARNGSSRAHLLVAEDNVVNQTVVLRMVEKLGYSADLVANGREAVEAIGRECYDLVLMDCQMPEMDGFRATAAIRAAEENGRRIPIIALTAHASASDREECLRAGMDDYLSKPLLLADLSSVLAQWTEGLPQQAMRG
jgi:CheY-like chemotaxis protein